MIKRINVYILFLISGTTVFSQPDFPVDEPVFTDALIPRIDIMIDPDSLNAIFDDVTSYHEYPAIFIFQAGMVADTVYQVGFRLRGNTSRYSPKKSFKVSFNTFIQGQQYQGLEKMNINGEHNDPSVIRSKLCWDILREFNIPAPRSNHVELYINGDYYGLYINVEHIDEEFVYSRFGNKEGNLFKCLWPADLNFFSSDPDEYKFTSGDRRAYDLRTNVERDNYDDLYQFIHLLNTIPIENLSCEIENLFNVDDFLKILAFDLVSGNWDGYSYNQNNYYLYHNTTTGKFEYIPYDLDNTLGIDWIGRDWGDRDIYDWAKHDENRPLHNRILEVPEYRDQFSWYLHQLVNVIMDTTTLFPRIDSLHTMITSSLEKDPYYPLNYGYTMIDFHHSYDQPLGGHVAYGLKPYITTRIETAKEQLEINNTLPVIKYILSNHPRLEEIPVISAHVSDDTPLTRVELVYSINNGPEGVLEMQDNGVDFDLMAADQIYTVSLDPVNTESWIRYRVRVNDEEGAGEYAEPCSPGLVHAFENSDPDLVINELMAGNDVTLADEYSEYDDWVELYNRDPDPVWLGDKYLSDDLQDPSRWLLPDSILGPGDFILIWTDGQNGQGPLHANFRLDKSGEEIGIFESPVRNSLLIDYLTFGGQSDDISFGRETDGGTTWIFCFPPTPGYSNTLTSIIESANINDPLVVYPNPVHHGVIQFNKMISLQIYDMTGKLRMTEKNRYRLDVHTLPPGIYILKSYDGEVVKIVIQ